MTMMLQLLHALSHLVLPFMFAGLFLVFAAYCRAIEASYWWAYAVALWFIVVGGMRTTIELTLVFREWRQ